MIVETLSRYTPKLGGQTGYVTEEDERGWGYMAGEYGGKVNSNFVYPVKDNAVFVMAIVIGKPANEDDVDVITWATNRARPNNWVIWD